jgi:hypothetical protein
VTVGFHSIEWLDCIAVVGTVYSAVGQIAYIKRVYNCGVKVFTARYGLIAYIK